MTQKFDTDFSKKLSFHFLEIFFFIFRDYCPCDFFNLEKKQGLKDYMKKEKSDRNKRMQKGSTRHSRFNTCVEILNKNSNSKRLVPGIPNSDMLRQRSIGHKTASIRKAKQQDNPTGMLIHFIKFGEMNFAGSEEEEKVKDDLKKMALDLLENSYNSLIDVLLDSFYSQAENAEDDHEKYKYIKITSFFMSFCRLNSQENFKKAKEDYRNKPVQDRGPAPKLILPVNQVSSSLKLQNIDFIFSKGLFQSLNARKADRKMDMYLASVEYLLGLLYIIKDMEVDENPKMQKNAQILKQKIFTLQICELAKFGLEAYEISKFPKYFIQTVLRFTDVLLNVLEVYSKGKTIYVQTHKIRHRAKEASGEDNEEDALKYYEDSGPSYVEQKFNFQASLMEFVSYTVVDNILSLLSNPEQLDPELVTAISTFINRVVKQVRGTWIFYQLKTLSTFDYFLSEYRQNCRYTTITNSIKIVLSSFFEKCKENRLLALEIVFPFPNKNTKEMILTNYDYQDNFDDEHSYVPNDDVSEEPELEIEEFKTRFGGWTDEDDQKLIEYYDIFKDSTDCIEKTAKILNRKVEEVQSRLVRKGLIDAKPKKRDTLDKAIDDDEPENMLKSCKDSVKDFIRASLVSSVPHQQIIDQLQHFHDVLKDYLDHEKSKSTDDFEM